MMDELAAGDFFQARDHAKGGGLAAAGGADQDDEFLVGNIQAELLHSHDALVGDLQVRLLLLRLVGLLFLGLFLILTGNKGINLFDVLQLNSSHLLEPPITGIIKNQSLRRWIWNASYSQGTT